MSSQKMRRSALSVVIFAVLALAVACSDSAPSTLDPGGPGARRIESLWWILFWISLVVCVVVFVGVGLALARRRRDGEVVHRNPTTFVLIAGAAIPFVVLAVSFGFSVRDTIALHQPPSGGAGPSMTIEVVGHQWWWEVRYPDGRAVAANEIHIPVGTDVEVKLTTDDVLHSFWVPQLMSKTDLIAGRTNTTWIRADEPGSYRGQCAEYCGLQHAHMAFMIEAQPKEEFDAWLAWADSPVVVRTAAQRRGQQVFVQTGCAACHAIRGTDADGKVGPDLTTVGQRWSLGAGTVPNDDEHMRQWISDPQRLKPGNAMPPQPVSPSDMPDLIAYLRSLKPSPEGVP